MSIDITITQKGLLKKALPLPVILGKDLQYGALEGERLEPGKLGEADLIAYLPEAIGRGIQIFWREGEKMKVELRSLTPTTREELRAFYDCVGRIAAHWKCDLEVDGEKTTLRDFQAGFENQVSFTLRALRSMSQEILEGKHESLTLHSAMFPLTLGREEAERFAGAESLSGFRDFLHEKQNMDVYYAAPMFYRDGEGVLGLFALREGVRSVFPKVPRVPLGMRDPETGKALQVDRWEITLGDADMKQVGQVSYDIFLARLPAAKVSRFDGGSVLVEGLTLSELQKIAE